MNYKPGILFLVLFTLVFLFSCENKKTSAVTAQDNTTRILNLLSDKKTDLYQLESLVDSLDSIPAESSSFWSDIANDTSYHPYTRGLFAMTLFKRHINSGMTLEEMHEKTGNLEFLSEENITDRVILKGSHWKLMHPAMDGDAGFYQLTFFPELRDSTRFKNVPPRELIIFIGVSEKIPPQDLAGFINGHNTGNINSNAKITGVEY